MNIVVAIGSFMAAIGLFFRFGQVQGGGDFGPMPAMLALGAFVALVIFGVAQIVR